MAPPLTTSRPSSPCTVPEISSMWSAWGTITRSTSTGSPTSGRAPTSNFTCSNDAPPLAVVTAETRYGDSESAGEAAFLTGAAALACVGAGSLCEPQPTAASTRPRTSTPGKRWRCRIRLRTLPQEWAPAHVRTSGAAPQQRGILDRLDLLEQVLDVPLPVARLADPGEGARKGRIAPPVRHPGCVVQ